MFGIFVNLPNMLFFLCAFQHFTKTLVCRILLFYLLQSIVLRPFASFYSSKTRSLENSKHILKHLKQVA